MTPSSISATSDSARALRSTLLHHTTPEKADHATFFDSTTDAAEARNGTHNAAQFRNQPDVTRTIDVLIPEAVTLITSSPAPEWVHDLRWDYRRAVDRLGQATSPISDEEAFNDVHELRKRIVSAGFTPLESLERPFEARHTSSTP